MWMGHCMEIHAVQLSTTRYHYLILLENGDSPLWLSALQFKLSMCQHLQIKFDAFYLLHDIY